MTSYFFSIFAAPSFSYPIIIDEISGAFFIISGLICWYCYKEKNYSVTILNLIFPLVVILPVIIFINVNDLLSLLMDSSLLGIFLASTPIFILLWFSEILIKVFFKKNSKTWNSAARVFNIIGSVILIILGIILFVGIIFSITILERAGYYF